MPRAARIALLALLASPLRPQTNPTARPTFAVASVKPDKAACCTSYGVGSGGGGGKDVTLKALIALAWRVQQFQIRGGPAWLGSDRFDVEGKAEDPQVDFDQLRLMLRSLLEDRFQLKLHFETRQSPVYALVLEKGGPRFKPSPDQASPDINGPAPPRAGPNRGAIRMGAGMLIGNAVPLSRFGTFLSQRLDRPILDKTNLAGRFDVELRWTPGDGENPFDPSGHSFAATIINSAGAPITTDPSGPSVFTAIQEQLGLKLESARAPVDVLVIDRAGKPAPN